ncbi:family 43 glycosylhydrolase [Microbacteriaceae bacterium VKM Ac-2855]|nr:family 43 glycosylhydrolase [Microbacteriaceae bacterium VKM Ac-2855]
MTELREDAFATPYCDPVFDGPTDPIVVTAPDGSLRLFYTQRRATLESPGVEWVHGTAIGVAASHDGGVTWSYSGVVDGLDPPGASSGDASNTHWAPDIVRVDGRYLMFLTWIEGVRSDWTGHARIVQFESEDLRSWCRVGAIDLGSDRVIDAAVALCGDGRYRLWYKDERQESTTWCAVSDTPADPTSWRVEGLAIGGRPHEGPKVFRLGGWFWMIVDEWRGQRLYRSADATGDWQQHGLLLADAEILDGAAIAARHADVVPLDDSRALLVYFTHPGWDGTELGDITPSLAQRRSHVRAAVLAIDGETLRVE